MSPNGWLFLLASLWAVALGDPIRNITAGRFLETTSSLPSATTDSLGFGNCSSPYGGENAVFFWYTPLRLALDTSISLCTVGSAPVSVVLFNTSLSLNQTDCKGASVTCSSNVVSPIFKTPALLVAVQEVGGGAVSFTLQVEEVPLCQSTAYIERGFFSGGFDPASSFRTADYGLPNCVVGLDNVVLVRRFSPSMNHMELLVSVSNSAPVVVVIYRNPCTQPTCSGAIYSFETPTSIRRQPLITFPAGEELLVVVLASPSSMLTYANLYITEAIPSTTNLACEDAVEVLPGPLYVQGASYKSLSVNHTKSIPCTDYSGLAYFFKYTIEGPTRFSTCAHDIFGSILLSNPAHLSLYTGGCGTLQCFMDAQTQPCPSSEGQFVDVISASPGTSVTVAVYGDQVVQLDAPLSFQVTRISSLNDACLRYLPILSGVPIRGDLRLVQETQQGAVTLWYKYTSTLPASTISATVCHNTLGYPRVSMTAFDCDLATPLDFSSSTGCWTGSNADVTSNEVGVQFMIAVNDCNCENGGPFELLLEERPLSSLCDAPVVAANSRRIQPSGKEDLFSLGILPFCSDGVSVPAFGLSDITALFQFTTDGTTNHTVVSGCSSSPFATQSPRLAIYVGNCVTQTLSCLTETFSCMALVEGLAPSTTIYIAVLTEGLVEISVAEFTPMLPASSCPTAISLDEGIPTSGNTSDFINDVGSGFPLILLGCTITRLMVLPVASALPHADLQLWFPFKSTLETAVT